MNKPFDDLRVHTSARHLRSLEGPARGLRFLPGQPSRSVLNGRHASRLRGRGLNFEELRNYLPGDDIRAIDWRATARMGKPHVRVFTEERDRHALLIVDQRMSMYYGTVLNMKSVTAAEAAALTAHAILAVGDRVGGLVYNDTAMVEIKPGRSHRAVNLFLNKITEFNNGLHADHPSDQPIPLNSVLQAALRMATHDNLIIMFSDFDGVDDNTHKLLTALARHNDLILTLITDPSAENLAAGGSVVASDGRLQVDLDLSNETTRRAVADYSSGRLAQIRAWQQDLGIAVLPLSTGEETTPQVRRLLGRGPAPRR